MKNNDRFDIEIYEGRETLPYTMYSGAIKWEKNSNPDELVIYPDDNTRHVYPYTENMRYTVTQTHRKVDVVRQLEDKFPPLAKSYWADVIYRIHADGIELIKNRFTGELGMKFKTPEEFWDQIHEWSKLQ